MRAISLRQPWASFVAHGFKEFETRGRNTNIRGPILIHATASIKERKLTKAAYVRVMGAHVKDGGDGLDFRCMWSQDCQGREDIRLESLPLGCIVAKAELVDCVPVETLKDQISEREYEAGNWQAGRYAWKLANVVPLVTPIPFKGLQGWFQVPSHLLEEDN